MAYETGTATDIADLISKLSTFAVANGWTEDRRDSGNGIIGLSKNSVFVSGRWDPASHDMLSLHQANAILPSSGTEPGDVASDSGNGYNTTSSHANTVLDDERHVELGPGPYPSYYFFENDSGPAYIHIVVETSTDSFVHFGFGEIDKVGDGWTGGEYVYGHNRGFTQWVSTGNTHLLSGVTDATNPSLIAQNATIRISGFPNQPVGTVWGMVSGSARLDARQGTDSAANARVGVQGGFQAGPFSSPWGVFPASKTSGLIPMYSIGLFYCNNDTENHAYFLGWQADVRGVNIRGIAPKEEIVIGSDTWVIFPQTKRNTAASIDNSTYSGVAYKKVTA